MMSHSTHSASLTMAELENEYLENPSLTASVLESFENQSRRDRSNSPRSFGYPSHHSGFRSETSSERGSSASPGRFSPPAWRREEEGPKQDNFWNSASRNLTRFSSRQGTPFGSRHGSPEHKNNGEDILDAAIRTRLPSGSLSPEKFRSESPVQHPAPAPRNVQFGNPSGETIKEEADEQRRDNYMRLEVRAEMQHAMPFVANVRNVMNNFSLRGLPWISILIQLFLVVSSVLLFRAVFMSGNPAPVPDLGNLGVLAKSFEPMAYYSEDGVHQTRDLREAGMAVWDLGESVRSANMSTYQPIVTALDDLADTLNELVDSMMSFHAHVDGDIDGILFVMGFAIRELEGVHNTPPSTIEIGINNAHDFFSRCGVFEQEGKVTSVGEFTTKYLGLTHNQWARKRLQFAFDEFVTELERAINGELKGSDDLSNVFKSVDDKFLGLARDVIREFSLQEVAHEEMLSSLWTKILGTNAKRLRKFEKNKAILSNIRRKTLDNKEILDEHNHNLVNLKSGLEYLRRKMVSPLVRAQGNSLEIEDQIKGLVEVSTMLAATRKNQGEKLRDLLMSPESRENTRQRIAARRAREIDAY